MYKQLIWSALALLVVCFAAFDLLIATVVKVRGAEMGGVTLGITFAQITLLAVWTALFPVSVLVRVPTGLCGAALVTLAIFSAVGRNEEALGIGGATFLQWFAIQGPFWIMRLIFGWRLAWSGELSAIPHRETQFGIRQLFVWTALVAVTLALARLVLKTNSLQEIGRNPQELVAILLLLAMFGSLSAWPIIWAAFVRTWMPLWMIAAACCCVGICVTESVSFQTVLGRGIHYEVFWWISAIQFVASSSCLLLVRFCGFRLVRASGLIESQPQL